jgi:hypothetical protein
MEKAFGDEVREDGPARCGIDVPEATCLREREAETGHFTVFTANTREKLLVRGHDGTLSVMPS